MKDSVNKVTLRGFLGRKPDVKEYASDKKVARASLATNESYRNSYREWVTETQWHNLVFWGKWASFAELNLKKGDMVELEGKLVNRSFVDKDGAKQYATDVVVNNAKVVPRDS